MIWLAVFISMLAHELAHAFVAVHYGDPAPRRDGRLTINPLAHISVWWTIILPAATFMISGGTFVFGSMKPIAITYQWLTPSQRWMVAAAGPAANVALAIVVLPFWKDVAMVNVMLAIVNLMPIKPLDGWRMIKSHA